MGKRLYVGSLPFDVNESRLRELFASCGSVVSVKLIEDKSTGASRGFGFVEMSSEEEAKAAIEKLNNTELGNRRIIVNEARPIEDKPVAAAGSGRGGNPGGRGLGGRGGERSGRARRGKSAEGF